MRCVVAVLPPSGRIQIGAVGVRLVALLMNWSLNQSLTALCLCNGHSTDKAHALRMYRKQTTKAVVEVEVINGPQSREHSDHS